jgi:hypothetical protein
MKFGSLKDWLSELENKKSPAVFVGEWLFSFALSALFWSIVFFEAEAPVQSTASAVAIATVYAFAIVYVRLLPLTRCKKCNGLVPLAREEIGRRHLHERERCLEVEHGGEQYWGHYIELYYKIYRVDVVRYRCRMCHAVWEVREESSTSDFRYARTIQIKD